MQGTATPTPAANDTGEGLLELFTVFSGRRTSSSRSGHSSRRCPSRTSTTTTSSSGPRLRTSCRAASWRRSWPTHATTIRGVFSRSPSSRAFSLRLVSHRLGRSRYRPTVGPYLDGASVNPGAIRRGLGMRHKACPGRCSGGSVDSASCTGFTGHHDECSRPGQVTVAI